MRLPCHLPVVVALTLPPQPGAAQSDATPAAPTGFEDAMAETLSDAGEARTLIRCGGMFRAFGYVASEGSDLRALAQELETDMAVFATVVRENETGETMEAAMDAIGPSVLAVSELYLARLRTNATTTDSVLDPELEQGLAYCRDLRDRLSGVPQ